MCIIQGVKFFCLSFSRFDLLEERTEILGLKRMVWLFVFVSELQARGGYGASGSSKTFFH